MAIVSRLQLDHPALGAAGGASLHASIQALYEKIGDNMADRFFSLADFDQAETVDLDHNFTTGIENLRFQLWNFTGGEWVLVTDSTTPATSDFTVVEKTGEETTVLQITNDTGGNDLTFAVVIFNDPIRLDNNDIKDVDVTTVVPVDGQALVYESASDKWKPGSVGAGLATPSTTGLVTSYSPTIQSSVLSVTTTSPTITTDDGIQFVSCTPTAAREVTLPSAAANTGRRIEFINTNGSFMITVARAGSDTIGGQTAQYLKSKGARLVIFSDGGTDWRITEQNFPTYAISSAAKVFGSTYEEGKWYEISLSAPAQSPNATLHNVFMVRGNLVMAYGRFFGNTTGATADPIEIPLPFIANNVDAVSTGAIPTGTFSWRRNVTERFDTSGMTVSFGNSYMFAWSNTGHHSSNAINGTGLGLGILFWSINYTTNEIA